jgi:hypothetical protein
MMGAVVGPKTQLANVLKVDLTEIPKPMHRARHGAILRISACHGNRVFGVADANP